MEDRKIGFIQGVVYAAAMMNKYGFDAHDLIMATNFSREDIKKYSEEEDIKEIECILNSL